MNLATIIGIQVGLLGLVAFGVAPRVRRRWPRLAAVTLIVPSLVVITGAALAAFGTFGGATPLSSTPNPVSATVTSVETGNRLYQANCAACHGVDAQGGGPLADTTPIQPPSLKAHLTQHTDGDLFYWITNGLPGGMPGWAATLSPTDRWNVVNYLRAINAGSSVPPASLAPPSGSGSPTTGGSGSAFGVLVVPAGWSLWVGLFLAMGRKTRKRRT